MDSSTCDLERGSDLVCWTLRWFHQTTYLTPRPPHTQSNSCIPTRSPFRHSTSDKKTRFSSRNLITWSIAWNASIQAMFKIINFLESQKLECRWQIFSIDRPTSLHIHRIILSIQLISSIFYNRTANQLKSNGGLNKTRILHLCGDVVYLLHAYLPCQDCYCMRQELMMTPTLKIVIMTLARTVHCLDLVLLVLY